MILICSLTNSLSKYNRWLITIAECLLPNMVLLQFVAFWWLWQCGGSYVEPKILWILDSVTCLFSVPNLCLSVCYVKCWKQTFYGERTNIEYCLIYFQGVNLELLVQLKLQVHFVCNLSVVCSLRLSNVLCNLGISIQLYCRFKFWNHLSILDLDIIQYNCNKSNYGQDTQSWLLMYG